MARHAIRNNATGAIRIVGTSALPFFPGYVIIDTYDDGVPPFSFPTVGEADLRYVNLTELSDPESPGSVALRAASVAAGREVFQPLTGLRATAEKLLRRLQPSTFAPFSTVATDVPTLSVGTVATLSGRVAGPQTGEVTEVGSRGVWDAASTRLPVSGISGLDFITLDTAAEIHFRAGRSGALPIWVFVDGQPLTATEDTATVGTITSGTDYYLKLTFGAAKRRRIEFFASHSGQWRGVRTAAGGTVLPAPRRPACVWVGDSFLGGSNGSSNLMSSAFIASRYLGVECFTAGTALSGTGYSTAGSFSIFGSTARVAAAAIAQPDLIVIQGSVNDDGKGTVQADAAACFAAHAAAAPNAPIIVLGPQPNAAIGTLSANRAANIAAVKAAATASAQVIGFHDEVGTASGTVPATWSNVTAYTDGSLAARYGSVWKLVNNGTTVTGGSGPGTDNRWQLQTWGYYGTGQVGSVVGDGNRDTVLYSDGTHPTNEGQSVLAVFTDRAIRADLTAYVATGQPVIT